MSPDLSAVRIFFVTAASNAVGFGHLGRCLALAAVASRCHADVGFLVFGSKAAEARIEAAGYGSILLDESSLDVNAGDWPVPHDLQADVLVVDLLFPAFAAACPDPSALFERLHGLGRRLVALDVLGDFSITSRLCDIAADLVVLPYVAQPAPRSRHRWRLLEGTQYALLPPEYEDLPPRQLRQTANRVLVSCGGSDPEGYTSGVLLGLEGVARELEVIVVIGPLFSPALRSEVAALAAASHHAVRLADAPRSLLEEMLWCDLAISASGLTKYELAASATPALLFSIDAFHDGVNRPFAATGTAIDMGVGIAAETVAKETERLLDDVTLRQHLATAGRMLVDGQGSRRLFTEIKKELSC